MRDVSFLRREWADMGVGRGGRTLMAHAWPHGMGKGGIQDKLL